MSEQSVATEIMVSVQYAPYSVEFFFFLARMTL